MPPPELNDQARLSVREASLAPLRDMCRIPGPKNSHMTTSVHNGNSCRTLDATIASRQHLESSRDTFRVLLAPDVAGTRQSRPHRLPRCRVQQTNANTRDSNSAITHT